MLAMKDFDSIVKSVKAKLGVTFINIFFAGVSSKETPKKSGSNLPSEI